MTQISASIVKMLVEELDQGSANSEAVQTKIGANINGLIEQGFQSQLFTSSGNWVAPANVTAVILFGIGGGGGGGQGGGDANIFVAPSPVTGNGGAGGGNSLFDGEVLAFGGGGGLGNRAYVSVSPIRDTEGRTANIGMTINGTTYGSSGGGGAGGFALNVAYNLFTFSGLPGQSGAIGSRVKQVVPSTSYAVVIGAGGAGGSGSGNGNAGAAGQNGALLVIWKQ